MKEISQEQFEKYIQEIIDENMTRKELIGILQSESRTVNRKIQELAAYNPELYKKFIKKYPYTPKQRTDIDYEALIIDILQKELMTEEASKIYGVSARTITRKIQELKKENPKLIAIYKEAAEDKKRGRAHSEELKEKIKQLVPREVKISENKISDKKEQLSKIERIFNQRCNFMSRKDAAESMGYTYNRIEKMLYELYRIKIEETAKRVNNEEQKREKETTGKSKNSFLEKLKVEVDETKITALPESTTNRARNISKTNPTEKTPER